MRASSRRPPPAPLSRAAARNAVLLNLCATPGLGSLMARRRLAGLGQIVLALAGFGLFALWFALMVIQMYNQLVEGVESRSVAAPGISGAALFAAAWLWSLMTSLSILREARAAEASSA